MRVALIWSLFGALSAVRGMESPALHPPVESASPEETVAAKPMAPLPATQWFIGSPSDDEQYYLEMINRARANPAAEGIMLRNTLDARVRAAYTYFGVDLAMMEGEFAALPVVQPLAFHSQLTDAARGHCQYLYDTAQQSHTGSGGSSVGTRISAAGYSYAMAGECVYSYSEYVFYGHAGFEVDWGPGGAGGMQAGRGHRVNIHRAEFREVGIAVINGSNTEGSNTVGPQLVVQDFAYRPSGTPLITGVVFTDADSDAFYDPGEGVGNITVSVGGGSYFAVTAASGGYAVPVSGNGTYTVTFTAANGVTVISTQTITISGGLNAKADVPNAPAGSGTLPPAPEIAVTRGVAAIADGGTDTATGFAAGVGGMRSYQIANIGSADLTVGSPTISTLVNCTASVTTAPASPVAAGANTTLGITLMPTAIGPFSCQVSMVTNDADENPANWTISGTATAPAPEIAVSRGSAKTDGGTDVVSGSAPGVASMLTYQIANPGTAALTLGAVTLGTAVNCTATVTTPPGSPVAAGGSTTMVLTITPTASGTWSVPLSLPNNDADENPFDLAVTSSGTGSGGGSGGDGGASAGGGCGAGSAIAALGLLALGLTVRRRR